MIVTGFSRRLGLRLPLIAAPMAGGPTTPDLVAAASSGGALGSFGFAYTQPEEMRKQADVVRSKTDRPFGINLFVAPQPEPIEAAAQLAAVEEIRPRVFTVHLGSLPAETIERFKKLEIIVGGSATCVAEAKGLEALGFDFVIAQGGEAGGHRGTYLRDPYEALTGTLALVRLVVRAVKLPVVAAGGIMDGAGIAAVLTLGAQAAQLGTAFIPCPESGAPQVHKDQLLKTTEDESRITEKFSGKPARGLANRFMKEMERSPQLAFPAQNSVTGKLRAASAKAGRPDFIAMWAGQAAPLARALPAAELIARLEAEAIDAIRRTAALAKD